MALVKLGDYYPDYQDMTSETGLDLGDIKDCDVYAQDGDKVGSVYDVLVDEQTGRFRYYVVDTGFWIFGKKVLVPVGMARIDSQDKRIYVNGLTKDQVEDLPNFDDLDKLDFEYEEQVRNTYRPISATAATTGVATPAAPYDRDSYSYDRDPGLYDLSNQDQQSLRLYEERLIANKQRQKVGEIEIGKRVETQTARVSVPVEKEKVVIERMAPTETTAIDANAPDFHDSEVARIEVFEETPDIHKEAFVREEVQVKKVVDRDVVQAEEELRREELNVDTQGRPIVDK